MQDSRGSSLLTYYAVRDGAAARNNPVSQHSYDMTKSASLLAAIHNGIRTIDGLAKETGYDLEDILISLVQLAEYKMVYLWADEGGFAVVTTEAADMALSTDPV